jgi:hypothetical protein
MYHAVLVSPALRRSVLGFCLLLGSGGVDAATAADVEALARRAAATVQQLHDNASRALVTAAQDEAFSTYFHTHDDHARAEIKSRIDRVSLSVQDRFHVEEMCLIDPEGVEISRIVGSEIAHDLATDEADAPFFAPGFETAHRRVHTSPIYLSPDASKWVIAYVTPVLVDGHKRSILHYEHALTAYTQALHRQAETLNGNLIVVTDTGHVIFDSRHEISIDGIEGREALDDYFAAFDLDGHDLASLRSALGHNRTDGATRLVGDRASIDVAVQTVGQWTIVAWQAI